MLGHKAICSGFGVKTGFEPDIWSLQLGLIEWKSLPEIASAVCATMTIPGNLSSTIVVAGTPRKHCLSRQFFSAFPNARKQFAALA